MIMFTACDTDIENIGYQSPPPDVDYAALREYKASDHEIMFGWFGNWNGGGASASTSLRSVPDSVDMVSAWGSWDQLTDKMKEDMKYVQEVKGTKVLACMFTPKVGKYLTPEGETAESYWGWDATDQEKQNEAMRKYSEALVKEVLDLGYDGIDMDNEPEDNNVYGNQRLTTIFVETVGKYMGPASGTGNIFAIDGYFWSTSQGMNSANFKYVDYFISQAYYGSGYSGLDDRFSNYTGFWKNGVDPNSEKGMSDEEIYKELARKFIVTEDFERHSNDGGNEWTLRPIDGVARPKTRACLGHADWKPYYNSQPMQKGGAGLYHIENDYVNSAYEYYWTRQMVQIMNPVAGN